MSTLVRSPLPTDSRFVEAELKYRNPATPPAGKAALTSSSAPNRYDPRRVRIYDARPYTTSLDLERNGFVLVQHATQVTDFFDDAQVRGMYRAEIEHLVASLTGAERVLTFRWKWRHSGEKVDPRQEDPAQGVHIDYDLETIRHFVRAIAGEADAARLLEMRLVLINVWRPLVPVECKPLALCDAATMSTADQHLAIIRDRSDEMPDVPMAGYNPSFNSAHHWYYFPHMVPGEALVFKLCDSDSARVQFTAHSTIDDPTSPPGAAPRQSFEIRTIAAIPR